MSIDESPRRWAASLGGADAIVISTKFNKHKHILALKPITKLPIHWANGGVSSVVKIIDDLIGEANAVENT